MGADLHIGRQFGDFLIRERIGRGGMATVYRAHQGSFQREVALKVIPLGAAGGGESFRRRFAQEAHLVASLEHIHILPVHDYGITEEFAYLAMRLLRGGTLEERLRTGPLEIDTAVELFRQFASGLRYAHERGVIHRDLKPANILLDDSGHALLADFGLAKLAGESIDLTQAGTVVGTPAYMSPEQVRGLPADSRSDIYSAGGVLYHMLTGRPPVGGAEDGLAAVMYRQVNVDPEPPSRRNAAIPPAVDAVVMRALSKDPARRYPAIEEMAGELARATGRPGSSEGLFRGSEFESESSRRAARPEAPPPGRRRTRVLAAAGAVAAVAGLLAVLQLAGTGGGAPEETGAATVRAGEVADGADARPTAEELARARRRLGGSAFIAHLTCTQRTEYHATQAREISELARREGLRYRAFDGDGDEYRQLTQIERARVEGAGGIILCPLNANLLASALAAVQSAGLPLVQLASGLPSYGGVLIAGDDFEMGLAAGRFAGELVARERGGRARVLLLDFPAVPSLRLRAEGLEAGLAERAPAARVVAHAKGGTREFASRSVGELLGAGVGFDLILSINDAGSFGAIAALESAGLGPEAVSISSVDAEALAREHIARGYFLRGSVATDREAFSAAAIGAMVKLLAGSTVPETYLVKPGPVVSRGSSAGDPGTEAATAHPVPNAPIRP